MGAISPGEALYAGCKVGLAGGALLACNLASVGEGAMAVIRTPARAIPLKPLPSVMIEAQRAAMEGCEG